MHKRVLFGWVGVPLALVRKLPQVRALEGTRLEYRGLRVLSVTVGRDVVAVEVAR